LDIGGDGGELARLFEPVTLGGLALRNRVVMTTHGPRLSQPRYLRYLRERSQDVALVGLSASLGVYGFAVGPGSFDAGHAGEYDGVPPHPLSSAGMAYYDTLIGPLAEQAATVHACGARAVGQLYHLGASQHEETTQPVIAPSDVVDEFRRHSPHTLTATEIADLVAAFGHAARRIVRAGLDAVEVHAAHGYLVQQFLSPLTNTRTDAYGGQLGNRLRFLSEIIEAVRELAGDVPVGVRLTGSEHVDGGLTVDDTCAVARHLAGLGVAFINVSGGNYSGLRQGVTQAYVAPAYLPEGVNAGNARRVRQSVDIPVIVAGRFTDLRLAARVVAEGGADLIGLTRALIADPRIVAKSRSGRFDEITPCVGGNECHYARQVTCAVNPAAGREDELEVRPARSPVRVLIVGGGPAGMECARVAAIRGHQVTLVDDHAELGGTIAVIARDPNRSEFSRYVAAMAGRLPELGVRIELGRRVTAEDVLRRRADAVVVATGSTERVPDVAGAGSRAVVTALQVLRGEASVGRHVVVVGGLDDHLPPLTVSDHLADSGRVVTLLTETDGVGVAIEPAARFLLIRRLLDKGVTLERLTALAAVRAGCVEVRNTFTNQRRLIEGVDTVVLACGRRPRRDLADKLQGRVPAIHVIGDSLAPRRMVNATLDGARAGVAI
jgi:2,4-dienoyl-CoA reductase-like NADH-dependent reductase (Old Yellow Enzyme family)/thioredoxin reductase